MFFSQLPVAEYTETVEYSNYPNAFLDVNKCGPFYFGNYEFNPNFVYIVSSERISDIPAGEWEVIECKSALVAYVPWKNSDSVAAGAEPAYSVLHSGS